MHFLTNGHISIPRFSTNNPENKCCIYGSEILCAGLHFVGATAMEMGKSKIKQMKNTDSAHLIGFAPVFKDFHGLCSAHNNSILPSSVSLAHLSTICRNSLSLISHSLKLLISIRSKNVQTELVLKGNRRETKKIIKSTKRVLNLG